MKEDIPHHQILLNDHLEPCDTGAVAVQLRKPNCKDVQIVPIFSVNMEAHWRYYLKPFDSILINWFGNHTLLNAILHELPCVITAKNRYIQEMKEDCFEVMQQAKEVAVCEHCGQTFEFNRYLTSENKKYQGKVYRTIYNNPIIRYYLFIEACFDYNCSIYIIFFTLLSTR